MFRDGVLEASGQFVQQGTGHGERMLHFRLWVLEMLFNHQPTHLIYEEPFLGRTRNAYGVLTRYAGVVEAAHFEHFGFEIPPPNVVRARDVKKAIGAPKGRDHDDNKRIVVEMVNARYGMRLVFKANDPTKKITEDDHADGIALNWAWHVLYRGEIPEDGADE